MNKSVLIFMIFGAVFNAVVAVFNFTQGNFHLIAINIGCAIICAAAAATYPRS
jgi:hypothetical protein